MSIKKTIEDAVDLQKKRNEDQQDYLKRVAAAISDLDDEAWKDLGQPAQEWFNKAVDAIEQGKDIEDFANEPPARRNRRSTKQEESAATAPQDVIGANVRVTNNRNKVVEGKIIECDEEVMIIEDSEGEEHEFNRARCKLVEFLDAAEAEETDAEPQVDDEVEVVTKRGKTITGVVVEIDNDVLVIDVDGDEVETSISTAKSIKVLGAAEEGEEEEEEEEEEGDVDPQVGDLVEAVTKRGKEVQGKVIEIDGDILVLDDGTDEIEIDMSTAKSVDVKAQKKPSSRASATASRTARGRSTAQTSSKEDGKAKKITAADNKGVSVTGRMQEIICEEPGISMDKVAKKLKSEKLVYNEQTLNINYKTVHKVIALLKKYKHMK